MQAIRQRVVDSVEIRVGEQRLIAVVHPGDAVFGGECLSTRDIARGHSGYDDVAVLPWPV